MFSSCESRISESLDFKEEMPSFVIGLSSWAKAENPNFVIIPKNGIELLTQNGEENSEGHESYLSAIDA
ncbi:MAG: cysteinyl-tRNA synthetase [Arcticibacterium sp.]